MINQRIRSDFHLKQVFTSLKPRRRKLFREKDSSVLKSYIPTLSEAEKIQSNMQKLHKRAKSKKKQKLVDLFSQNISLFCRLNKQKSTYEQLFSKNKENRQTRKKLKRCTSAHVKRTRTFQQEHISRESFTVIKNKRPLSSYSTKNHRKFLTIQSQF